METAISYNYIVFLTFAIISSFITVLIAHNGYKFDFPLLFNEITRREPAISLEMLKGIYFAESLEYLRQVHISGQYSSNDTSSYTGVNV